MKRRFDCLDFIGVHRISFQATLPKQEIGLSRVLEATAVAVYVENTPFFQIELDAFPLGECKKARLASSANLTVAIVLRR